MKNPVKKFGPNLDGRDFVISDLHGAYGVLRNLLDKLNFDPAKDRLFSVGDLVDRGPNSKKCLELIYEPWFHPVFANHEQLMLECFRGGRMGQYWYGNGGTWGIEAVNDYCARGQRVPSDESQEIIDMLEIVDELPFLITVETKSGKKYHILHAELPTGMGKITDKMLEDPEEVRNLATVHRGDGDAFLWSRAIFRSYHGAELVDPETRPDIIACLASEHKRHEVFNDELSHVISGHTILQHPMTIVGQTNIDTCAYGSIYVPAPPYSTQPRTPPKWAALTCIELDTWKFYQATETEFREVEPLVFTREEILAAVPPPPPPAPPEPVDPRLEDYDF